MTVLAFVSTQARERARAASVDAPVARGRHAAPFVMSTPGPFVSPTHLRVYHPALTAPQRQRHLSSRMARNACAVWSGLLTTSLVGATGLAQASGSELLTAFAAATVAAATGGLVVWHRAGRGAREVTAQLRSKTPGEPVIAHARLDRLDPTMAAAFGTITRLVDRDGTVGVQARQAVWEAARGPQSRFSRRA
jgi:hypothetical protein